MNNSTVLPRKILFICDGPLAISTGTHQRVSHLLKALAAIGEVTLVYPTRDGQIGPDLARKIHDLRSTKGLPLVQIR